MKGERDDGASPGDGPARGRDELQRLAELLDAGDACILLDPDWRITYVNANQERLSRKPRSETLGRVFWEVWPATAVGTSSYWREYHRCMLQRVPVSFDEYYAPLDLWTSVSAYPQKDGGVAVFFRDATEQKRLQQALTRSQAALEAFFAASPGILNLFDRELRYLNSDPNTPRYFGLERETLIGQPLTTLAPQFVEQFGPMIRSVVATGRPQLNVEVGTPLAGRAGAMTYWLASYFPVPLPGSETGVGVMGVEITELKRAEDALKEADRRKDEFLAMLSHELRNPLAPIRNSIYLLGRVAADSEQARRAREVIERQTEHLTRLVDDLLDVTRIARGKMKLRRDPLELVRLLHQLGDDFRPVFEARRIAFELQLPPMSVRVLGDDTRIRQAISNLLDNAVKFTRAGGRVLLALQVVNGDGRIVVRDTGAGIERSVLPQVFEPFVQGGESGSRTRAGLGLGLALVKGIVQTHGGRVAADSAGPGHGSEFTLWLPLSGDQQPQPVPTQPAPASTVAQRQVLVVDDNHDTADSLVELLRTLGHRAEAVYDGETALARVRARAPDVVLCDIGLPAMSGYEVARQIRAGGAPGLRLVAVSGYARPDDVQRAIDAGFDVHLAKPCEIPLLERLLA